MADYIIEPLDTDADSIYQDFVEYMQQFYPEWEASEGQLDVMIARFFSMQTAFTADMASRVQRAIFRYFGSSLAGIPPHTGTKAFALVSFTIEDPVTPPLDRVLPFGTLIGLTDSDGDVQMFELMDDMEVPAGTTSAQIAVEALEEGIAGNNIRGSVELLEQSDWIQTGQVVGSSSGGSDPEEDEAYIQRLTNNLALMAPRPILADDFAVMARNIPGVHRAAVLDNFRPGVNEVQTITSTKTGGQTKVEFLGQTSGYIPFNATKDQIYTALTSLSTLDLNDIEVTGGPLGTAPVVVKFKGSYAYLDVTSITIQTGDLTGPGTASVAETTPGDHYYLDQENAIGISAIDEVGAPLLPPVRDELIVYLESTRAQNFIITFVDPVYYTVDIDYTVRIVRGEAPDSVKTIVDENLRQYLNPASWGKDPSALENVWIKQTALRYLELTTVVENTPGVDYIESLVFRVNPLAALDSSDEVLQAAFGLTRPGVFNGTANMPI